MITPPAVNEADVRLAASGDRSAYERLVRRCAGLVTAVALSVVRDVELQARARDDEEREGLRRYALLSGTAATVAVLGMCFGTVFEWPYPVFMVLWAAYVALWDALVLVYLPRVMARRLALERAEDPAAEARQRRGRRKVIAMVSFATLCTVLNLGLVGYAMWRG